MRLLSRGYQLRGLRWSTASTPISCATGSRYAVGGRRQEAGNVLTVVPSCAASAFIPVVETAPIARPPATMGRPTSPRVRVKTSLPNGVQLELEGVDAQALSAMIEALGRCDVPAG